MAFPPRFLDEIRARVAVSDIVGKRIKITRAGREFRGCCPFHREKTPSFYVNDDKGFYHCFGCGAHGDAIGFVMRHDNRSFIEAVEQLAAEAGVEVPKTSPEDAARSAHEKSLYTLLESAARFFEERLSLQAHSAIKAYVAERGITNETADRFRLGCAPPDGRELITHLLQGGFRPEDMIAAGIAKRSDRDGSLYSFFRDRVMFPVADKRGRIVAFGGRILPDTLRAPDRDGFKPPKYINSPESPLFHKGRMLYGESLARRAVADGAPLMVVEGYMDVIACHQAGLVGAVAPLGTALTDEQIAGLWTFFPSVPRVVHLCFDGDEAGDRAASRALERLLPALLPDASARFVFLPQGADPDSIIRAHGVAAMRAALDQGGSLIDRLIGEEARGRNLHSPEERAGLDRAVHDRLGRVEDPGLRYHLVQEARTHLRALVPKGGAQAQGAKQTHPAAFPARPTPSVRPAASRHDLRVRLILLTLIHHPFVLRGREGLLWDLQAVDPETDRVREALAHMLDADPQTEAQVIATSLQTLMGAEGWERLFPASLHMMARCTRPDTDAAEAQEGFDDLLRTLQTEALARDIAQVRDDLKESMSPENENRLKAYQEELGKLQGG